MACDAASLLAILQEAACTTRAPDALGARVVQAVHEALPQASWVGIYWLRGAQLHLGPFVGPDTEHTCIAVGRGICGTAVAEDRDLRVGDVREVENYLACSPRVRSELVLLIRAGGVVVGQLDLDAERVDAFSEDEHCALRTLVDGLGGLIEPPPPLPPMDNLAQDSTGPAPAGAVSPPTDPEPTPPA